MTAARLRDEPWQRLVWLVPTALLLSLLSLTSFLLLLTRLPAEAPRPPTLDLAVIELPPSPPAIAPAPAPLPEPPVLEEPQPAPVEPPEPAPAEPIPLPEPAAEAPPEPPPPHPQPKPVSPPSPPRAVAVAPPVAAAPPRPAPPAPAEPPPAAGDALGTGNSGARAIYQPLPEIPEALRRRRIELVTVARFEVSPSGSATVELITPTSEPELNRVLLETLKSWRFFPAMSQGKPVASAVEIRIPVSVR
jgi:protein TonB